jgi:hypothetical protein
MKQITLYMSLTFILLLAVSCQKDVLNKRPLDKILETQVWEDPSLLDAYVTNVYSRIQLPLTYAPNPTVGELMFAEAIVSDEGLTPHTWHGIYPRLFGVIGAANSHYLEYWDWTIIRDINTFLENGANNTATVVDPVIKKQRLAEMRFMRAYTYFEFVKRFGGVPLITKAQSVDDPKDELFAKRETEQKIYDYILSEVDAVLNDLPTDVKTLRFTKWAALALKSRAALYAGSIAKYGSLQLNGLLGIQAADANKYFKMAYDASKALIPASDGGLETTGRFTLYKVGITPGNPTSFANAYYNLFITEGTSESIFEKRYKSIDLGNSLNKFENAFTPTAEFLNSFENIDGSNPIINFDGAVVSEQSELWIKREPRFHGAFRWDQTPWFPGDTMYTHNYVITKSGSTDVNPANVYFKGNGKSIRGAGNYATTGSPIYRKKFSRPILEPNWQQSTTPAIIFRLGESYLNAAEAAFELGIASEALGFVNKIRERGGVPPHSSIDMVKIMRERKIELMFEGHRFYDLKRWRLADKTMAQGGINGRPNRIEVYYDLRDDKYKFLHRNPAYPNPTVFKSAYNYHVFRQGWLTNNTSLVQNPGY